MEFAEQVVLITGASRGIGEQVAYRFARAGASLVLTYYQGREDARRVAKRCRELGACDALALYVNVMDNDTIRAAVQTVQQRFGTVVVLINNAGVILWKAFADHTLEDIETLYRTNAEGVAKIAVAFFTPGT